MRFAKKLLIEHLRSLAAQGKTLAQAAGECGLAYNYLSRLSSLNDISFTRQIMAPRPGTKTRAQEMRQRYEDGETLESIGKRYGVTRERVRQIMTKEFGTNARDGGQAEQSRRRRREFHKKRDARSIQAWGCKYAEYRRILKHPGKPTYAFSQQRKNAQQRGIGWEMTLWQWWKVWEKSDHWSERGRGRGYGMCRTNDTGPYAVDNVYIATGVENIQDHWVNRRARNCSHPVPSQGENAPAVEASPPPKPAAVGAIHSARST
jgi:hypothetical protein